MRLWYACSTNSGKLAEFALAAGPDAVIRALPGLEAIRAPEESGKTFGENAVLKAVYYSQFAEEPVFADDSGLEVDALRGAPGVYSARFAGQNAGQAENNNLLLQRLKGSADRRARFVTALALAKAGALLGTSAGTVEGEIVEAPRGENGFGYDPLFLYPPLGRTFAELTGTEKLEVSARGKALRALLQLHYK